MLEQRVTDAGADLVGMNVEVREPVAVERGEAAAEDEDLAVPHATAEEREMLVVRVELREEVERPERPLEDGDDLLDVRRRGASEHGRRLRACASATSLSA